MWGISCSAGTQGALNQQDLTTCVEVKRPRLREIPVLFLTRSSRSGQCWAKNLTKHVRCLQIVLRLLMCVLHCLGCVSMPESCCAYRHRDRQRVQRRCIHMPERMKPDALRWNLQRLQDRLQMPFHEIAVIVRLASPGTEHQPGTSGGPFL